MADDLRARLIETELANEDAADAALAVVADWLRDLTDSWRHDPDCQVGRRELGGKACAHFTERWRDQCRAELLAALTQPSTEEP